MNLYKKILRSLSKTWEAKMTIIKKAKHLNKLSLEKLIGSFMTHELSMNQNVEEAKRRKTIALKPKAKENEEEDTSKDFDNDDEMAMIATRLRRFVRIKRYGFKKKSFNKGEGSKEKERDNKNEKLVLFYEFKKPRHFRVNCPYLRRPSKSLRRRLRWLLGAMIKTQTLRKKKKSQKRIGKLLPHGI